MKFTNCELRIASRLARAESGAEATAVQTRRAVCKRSIVAAASGLRSLQRRFSPGSTTM